MDVSEEQLTLYVEFIPDGKGAGVKAAMEAFCRVKEKSWINSAIDGRPIVVVMMVREHTVLVPMAAVVLYDNGGICDSPPDELDMLRGTAQNMTFLYNGSDVHIIDRSTGYMFEVNTSEFKDKIEAGSFLYSSLLYTPVIYKYSECQG